MRATGMLWASWPMVALFGCSLTESDPEAPLGSPASQVERREPDAGPVSPKPTASGPDRVSAPSLPALTKLRVRGVEVLTPSFDSAVRRYSVRATDPVDELSITATADAKFSIEIAGQPSESGEAMALPDVEPGSDVPIRVIDDDGLIREYTLVYLPHEFPQMTVTIKEPEASPDPIYVAMRSERVYHLAKLDENGVPLFYMKSSTDIRDFKKHPNGVVSYATNIGGDVAGGVWEHVILDSNFEEVERVQGVGLRGTDHHDFHIRDNGNFVLHAYEPTTHDLSEFGLDSEAPVIDAVLQELSPEREVLFEWHSWDHLPYDGSIRFPNAGADYTHMNSTFVDADGNWILSLRNFSQVVKIDRSTGEILWRLGGKENEFTILDDPLAGFCGQHTVRRVGNGNLLLFDNGVQCWPTGSGRGKHTRVVEYEIDEEAKTARLVWSFEREGTFTGAAGSAQRLPNGNTFIGWGNNDAAPMASEVDRLGNIVYEIDAQGPAKPARSYRAHRVAD